MRGILLVLMVATLTACGMGGPSVPPGPAALNSGGREADGRVWTSRCSKDRFTDQTACVVSAAVLGRGTPFMAGTISSNDLGRSWVVAVMPAPRAIRLRVDARPTIAVSCAGAQGACVFDAADSRRLTNQFRVGRQIAFEAQLTTGPVDADFTAEGFTDALKAASAGRNF